MSTVAGRDALLTISSILTLQAWPFASISAADLMKQQPSLRPRRVYLIVNGDLRLSANQKCWPAQEKMEAALSRALQAEGWKMIRAHLYDRAKRHGFIDSQKMGLEIFRALDLDAPLIVAEAVWQYSQHILPGLFSHRGPVLTVANW